MSRSLVSLKDFKNWNIFSGLCIRRPAVITPELTPLEKQVADLYKKIEFERSYLSAHELRHEVETKNISNALSKAASTNSQESLITAREMELMWELDAEKYKPAERLTENDRTGNLKSAWRVLDKQLYLLVQSSKNISGVWNLPTAPVCNGKNLRQIADSLASSLLPSAAKWCIIGNAPVGVWLTPDRNKEDTGIQVYFFNVYVDRHWYGDDLILNNNQSNVEDFVWIPRIDFKKFIKHNKLLKTIKSFAIEY